MFQVHSLCRPIAATCCRVRIAAVALSCCLIAIHSSAGDWPQILGPNRNGVAKDETIAPWTKAGLKAAWTYPLGMGYAGPAVAGERVVVFHRVDDVERIEALDVASGRSLWKADFPATYAGGINADTGPRCVPVIHGQRVFVFGAAGHLHAVKLADGSKLWSRDTFADFRGLDGYFGAGSTPIAIGDSLLVNVGGRGDAGLVAFSADTGKTLWQAFDERASYSSPIEIRVNQEPLAVFAARLQLLAVEPATGKVAFQQPFGQTGPTVTAASPVAFDDLLFVTASYGIGGRLLRIGGPQPVTVWENDTSLSSQYNTPIYRDGFLYGIHGREDIGAAELRCVEAKTGKVQWTVEDFGVAHLILAGDKLLALKIDGKLELIAASPKAFQSLAKADASGAAVGSEASGGRTRALPALANGRFFVRVSKSDDSGGVLRCLTVAPPAKR